MSLPHVENLIKTLRPVDTQFELIRIGGESDGGYLVPNDLAGIQSCFSPGVSNLVDFELDMVSRGITCYLADASIEKCPVEHQQIDFEKKYLGERTEGAFITLKDWVQQKQTTHSGDLLLQMDIEGGEYPVLLETPIETLKRFRILVIEFHYLTSVFDPVGHFLISKIFSKLLSEFFIVHIHPNNYCSAVTFENIEVPPVIEFTFLRKDRTKFVSPATKFPHPLDRRNCTAFPDVILSDLWHG